MKTKIILGLTLVFFLAGINMLSAQSDYETVQNFKKEVSEIEQAIRNADSTDALEAVNEKIDKLGQKYGSQKTLLDNSLYPDNMDKTLDRLRNTANLRQGDFGQITELKTTVTGLKEQVDTLSARNDELSRQFALLESQSNERIAQLEKVVAQLRVSLQKRDQIVMNMISDLLPSNYSEGDQLSAEEKQEVVSKAERNNVVANIKRAVSDNIRFLEATRLYPEDLRKVKAQQDNFSRIWKSAGPTIVELYAEKGKRTDQINDVNDAFSQWDAKINEEVWSSIKSEFDESGINLSQFSTGKEFTSSVTGYIDEAVSNIKAMGSDAAEREYKKFDSTWNKRIEVSWMSFLLDNKLLTENEQDSIETKLATWEDAVYPEKFNWLYVVIGILALAVIVLLFLRRSPKSRQEPVQQRTS